MTDDKIVNGFSTFEMLRYDADSIILADIAVYSQTLTWLENLNNRLRTAFYSASLCNNHIIESSLLDFIGDSVEDKLGTLLDPGCAHRDNYMDSASVDIALLQILFLALPYSVKIGKRKLSHKSLSLLLPLPLDISPEGPYP